MYNKYWIDNNYQLNIWEWRIFFVEEIIKILSGDNIKRQIFKNGYFLFKHQMLGQLVYTPIPLPFRILIDQEADISFFKVMQVWWDKIITDKLNVGNVSLL